MDKVLDKKKSFKCKNLFDFSTFNYLLNQLYSNYPSHYQTSLGISNDQVYLTVNYGKETYSVFRKFEKEKFKNLKSLAVGSFDTSQRSM